MTRRLIREILADGEPGAKIRVSGWVRTRRDSKGGFSFLRINDGSCVEGVQVVVDGTVEGYEEDVLGLYTGASVSVVGTLVESPGSGQRVEIQAETVEVHGPADPSLYPLQKKKTSLEHLREIAHLRPRTNTFGAVMRIRNALAFATHRFFQDRSFLYLHTPIITASDCEGAGEMFRVSARIGGDDEREFFGKPTFLTVSGQLEAEAYACGLGRVYAFGPTFRAEDSNTRRHLSEFWMVEPEMAFADLDDDVALAEDYIRFLLEQVIAECAGDLAFLEKRADHEWVAGLRKCADAPFERMTYTEAIDVLGTSGTKFEFPVEWGLDLQSEHERFLADHAGGRPVVVTDFPAAIKPFYMRMNDDGRTAAALDVILPGVGEIIGGSQREERLDVLSGRMSEKGMDPSSYDWFLDLRRFGTAPHAGFGLGFERMVQFCTGMRNIRDVIPFPRTPGSAEF